MTTYKLYNLDTRKEICESNSLSGISKAARLTGVYISRGSILKFNDGHYVREWVIRDNKVMVD